MPDFTRHIYRQEAAWAGGNLVRNAFDLLFPPHCLVCLTVNAGSKICHRCLPPLPDFELEHGFRCRVCFSSNLMLDSSGLCRECRLTPPLFRHMRFLWGYDGRARDLIHAMKYRPSPRLASLAGALLGSQVCELLPALDWNLIVPIPSSKGSLRERFFNQCIYIAKSIRRTLAKEYRHEATLSIFSLRHLGYRKPQASLAHEQRIGNVRHTFAAAPKKVTGMKILLIDDVITTGATASAAAKALLQAGAVSVDLLALCRANTWSEHRQAVAKAFAVSGDQKQPVIS